MSTFGEQFLQEQVGYLTSGDYDGLMKNQYHADAEMVTFEFTCKGADAIKKYLSVDEPAKAGKILGMQMHHFSESDDVIIFVCSIQSEKLGIFVARDALFLKDKKIFRHIALTIPPDSEMKIYRQMETGKLAA
ncbi:MAG: hypothetical protein A3F73_07645 [Gallionellales bacterium RIFCSPLOWO2_12_FULL_59_22]|nr:MAG: hypothetical protein A2Z65_03040 [Gallionellales bacterium RIFCSPLOWO2_02_58_13]OGT13207.1 MAG: hypothetical protein A3F73_07645 [Gallionellales bacterium RIFCSPLOWO2_12_FULL_59_22]